MIQTDNQTTKQHINQSLNTMAINVLFIDRVEDNSPIVTYRGGGAVQSVRLASGRLGV